MNTEALNEILRQDYRLPDGEESNMDVIVYIMEIIADREKKQAIYGLRDADVAWKSFNENYRPFIDEKSLYEDDEDDEVTITQAGESAAQTSTSGQLLRRRKSGFLRLAGVAAAVMVLAFACSLTAYAMGFDLWGAVATWTKETFGFEAVAGNRSIPEQLSEFELLMNEHGLTGDLLPSYLPGNYSTEDMICNEGLASTVLYCQLMDGENSIVLQYTIYEDGQFATKFEKDYGEPEILEIDNTKYYIMTNAGTYYAVWASDNVECCISDLSSHDELIQMLISIGSG